MIGKQNLFDQLVKKIRTYEKWQQVKEIITQMLVC